MQVYRAHRLDKEGGLVLLELIDVDDRGLEPSARATGTG